MRAFLRKAQYDLAPLFASGQARVYQPGATILDIQDSSGDVMLVRQGVTRISMLSDEGTERLLFFGHAGSLIGDIACFGRLLDVPAGVRASAVTTCEVVRLKQDSFRDACRRNPAAMDGLLSQAYAKIASVITQLESAAFYDTTTQVAALIRALWLENAESGIEPRTDMLRMTHQMIAAATGRTRVSVTYALNRLSHDGAVRLHRGRIELLDPAILSRHIPPCDRVLSNV